MSAVDHCGNNAAMEGFFGLLKRERIYRRRYLTLAEARAEVFDYIERFHNPRLQRRLDPQIEAFKLFDPNCENGVAPGSKKKKSHRGWMMMDAKGSRNTSRKESFAVGGVRFAVSVHIIAAVAVERHIATPSTTQIRSIMTEYILRQ